MLGKQGFCSSLLCLLLMCIMLHGCDQRNTSKQELLYATHCGSCHIAPEINNLPRDIWESNILPDMAARMGIKVGDFNPYRGLSFDEMEATMQTGIYNVQPALKIEEWNALQDYILSNAPDSLPPISLTTSDTLKGFRSRSIALDSLPGSRNITYLKNNDEDNYLLYGDLSGEVHKFYWDKGIDELQTSFRYPVVSYSEPEGEFVTTIGQLNPTQLKSGEIFAREEDKYIPFGGYLHRPVHSLVEDLNDDGNVEIVISEFGDLAGSLSLFYKTEAGEYQKKTLLHQPGSIRTISRDMNNDGRTDLIVLTAQGDEGVSILYQEEALRFRIAKVIRFSPVYGTSWFDLLDYEGDGDLDIVTVQGDNADKSYVQKPYHGFRIHINDGSNNFEEEYFYPMYGATRVLASDFDKDGDFDFCLLATFPNYEKEPLIPFVYLQNDNSATYSFSSQVLPNPFEGRWLLVDSGDIDRDGDEDIILSPFTYIFTPVPEELQRAWNQSKTDLLVLENTLIDNEQEGSR